MAVLNVCGGSVLKGYVEFVILIRREELNTEYILFNVR